MAENADQPSGPPRTLIADRAFQDRQRRLVRTQTALAGGLVVLGLVALGHLLLGQ